MTDQPDLVYDDHPINERWWDFLRENEIGPGDKLVVKTETTEWKSKMPVIEKPDGYGVGSGEVFFETASGKQMTILTHSNTHPLEPTRPMVRTVDGYESKGVLDRVEVFKYD